MTLPSSPPLSMSQIAGELGQSLPLSLNDTNARTLAGIPSGPISILDFLGKSNISFSANMVVGSYSPDAEITSYGYGNGQTNQAGDYTLPLMGSFSGSLLGITSVYAVYTDDAGGNHVVIDASNNSSTLMGKSIYFKGGITVGPYSITYQFSNDTFHVYRFEDGGINPLAQFLGQSIQVGIK